MAVIKSITEIIKLEQLLFPVAIIDNPANVNSAHEKIIVAQTFNNGEMHLNYCSSVYELVPNSEIFPEIEKILNEKNVEYSVIYKHIDHVRFYAEYRITDKNYEYEVETGDIIQPKLIVQHSYNGLTKYSILFGYFRLVCSNGLVIPLAEMDKFNLSITGKHTKVIGESLETLKIMLNNFINNAKNINSAIAEKYRFLAKKMISNPKKRILEVLKGCDIAAVENKKFDTVEHILNIVKSEAKNKHLPYKGKVNDWLIYNGINQYINDEVRYKKLPEKRREFDQKVFEYMLIH